MRTAPGTNGTLAFMRSAWGAGSIAVAVSLTTACGGLVDGEAIASNLANLFRAERAAVAYAEHRFVTAGKFGITVSEDGISFASVPDTGAVSLSVAHGPSGWVVPDVSGLFTSADGLTWEQAASPLTLGYGVTFGGGSYVLVGEGGAIAVSEDARTWSAVPSPTEEDLLGVAFIGDRFYAVGKNGTAVSSFDGRTWWEFAVPTSVHLRGIADGAGAILLSGDRGTLLRSTDGEFFQLVSTRTNAYLMAATFAAGRFVVVGESATVLVSDDGGATFRAASVELEKAAFDLPNHFYGVTYGQGLFVAVGQTIIVSPDGVAWVQPSRQPDGEVDSPP